MDELIAQYFTEMIVRVVPGLIIIALYWQNEATNVFHVHARLFASPTLFVICILATAWLLGWLLDMLISGPCKFIELKWKAWKRKKKGEEQQAMPESKWENEILKIEVVGLRRENEDLRRELRHQPPRAISRDLERETRRDERLFGALSVMFRNVFFVSLFSWLSFLCPHPTWLWQAPEQLAIGCSYTCSIFATLSTLLGWRLLRWEKKYKEGKANFLAQYPPE